MTQEQLRMQMLAGIIIEGQYKAKLNENKLSKEELFQQLISLASSGELTSSEIYDIHKQLLSVLRKLVANKRTPEQRKASAAKAKITKERKAKEEAAKEEVIKILGLEDDPASRFALFMDMHRDHELQKRYNDEMKRILKVDKFPFPYDGEK